MTLREAFAATRTRLEAVTDEARTEASILLSHLTGQSPSLLRISDEELDSETLEALEAALSRRESGEPLQYVLGEWGFMGLTFFVSPDALIPRQDTETLCEEAARLIKERGFRSLLDICTGTGCIAVSLSKLTGVDAEASDISPACAELALRNAKRNGAPVSVRTADLFDGAGVYDIVTANPPYISDADMASLQREVAHEPRLALAGGRDGLDIYRRIAQEAAAHISPGGVLLMEVGRGQAEDVAALFPGRESAIIKDLNGIGRVVRIDF